MARGIVNLSIFSAALNPTAALNLTAALKKTAALHPIAALNPIFIVRLIVVMIYSLSQQMVPLYTFPLIKKNVAEEVGCFTL